MTIPLPEAVIEAGRQAGLQIEGDEILWSSNETEDGRIWLDHWMTGKHGDIRIELRITQKVGDNYTTLLESAVSTPLSETDAIEAVRRWGALQDAARRHDEHRREQQE